MPTLKLVLSGIVFVVANITGNARFELGVMTNIRCSTPVPVQSIQWVDQTNNTVKNGTDVQDLDLNIMITIHSNNTQYMCEVSNGERFLESVNITIEVGGTSLCLPDLKVYVLI